MLCLSFNFTFRNIYSQDRYSVCSVFQFHNHVSVSNLYIPRVGLSILLQPSRHTAPGNIYCSQIHDCRNWERGRAFSFLPIHKSVFRYSANWVWVLSKTYISRPTCPGESSNSQPCYALSCLKNPVPLIPVLVTPLPVSPAFNPAQFNTVKG
jgi:hypothetical protein